MSNFNPSEPSQFGGHYPMYIGDQAFFCISRDQMIDDITNWDRTVAFLVDLFICLSCDYYKEQSRS